MPAVVSGTYVRAGSVDTPDFGWVSFTLVPAARRDDEAQVTDSEVRAYLDETGSFSVTLVAASDLVGVDGDPVYLVRERVGALDRSWNLLVPDDTPIDLPAMWPGDSVAPGTVVVTGPAGPAGPAGDDGADGAPGQDGADGADGAPGAPGADGETTFAHVWAAGLEPGGATPISPIIEVSDPVTGRLVIAGQEMGDTGWRNVSQDVESDWVVSTALLRRIGPMVYLSFEITGGDLLGSTIYNVPDGFRFKNTGTGDYRIMVRRSNTTSHYGYVNSSHNIILASPRSTGTAYFWYVVAPVADSPAQPWPTTLPGTPA